MPADHWLALERDGSARIHRRWTPPDPTLALADGAGAVHDALAQAVHARTAQGGTITCDLSGGMDSTSLAFLACQGPARVVTLHQTNRDTANDDTHYAHQAAACLPQARHRELPYARAVSRFAVSGPGASLPTWTSHVSWKSARHNSSIWPVRPPRRSHACT
ncbi:hypothetical protein GXW82_42795 [Streptacidiphilus sp. 4-A2]|nr:hypothetical protein [Streptacidiphilus sp. 4-A2]